MWQDIKCLFQIQVHSCWLYVLGSWGAWKKWLETKLHYCMYHISRFEYLCCKTFMFYYCVIIILFSWTGITPENFYSGWPMTSGIQKMDGTMIGRKVLCVCSLLLWRSSLGCRRAISQSNQLASCVLTIIVIKFFFCTKTFIVHEKFFTTKISRYTILHTNLHWLGDHWLELYTARAAMDITVKPA